MKKKHPNILALDTSSPVLRVAVKKGRAKAQEARLEGFLQHAENLLPVTARLLRKNKLSTQDVDVFLIGRGPGSFTGLRIGFATLKGLRVLQKKECYGALSLDLIADHMPLAGPKGPLVVAMDAYRSKVYARFFKKYGGRWCPQNEAQALTLDELIERLPEECRITGDVCLRYEKQFLDCGKKVHLAKKELWYPRASSLIYAYEQRKTSPGKILKRLSSPEDFIPLYHRLSEAEERKSENAAHR